MSGAALVVIGDEIISGVVQDKNAALVASSLASKGIYLSEVRILPDNIELIANTINYLRAKVKYLFLTGGIGSTHDDVTAEAVAKAFECKCVKNKEIYDKLVSLYGTNLSYNQQKMSFIPEGARLLRSKLLIPSFIKDNVFALAGVPSTMQDMLNSILDELEEGEKILIRAVNMDVREIVIADSLRLIQEKYPMVQIGSYPPTEQQAYLRIILKSKDSFIIEEVEHVIMQSFEKYIVGN